MSKHARNDYDPDQPRDEKGRFSSTSEFSDWAKASNFDPTPGRFQPESPRWYYEQSPDSFNEPARKGVVDDKVRAMDEHIASNRVPEDILVFRGVSKGPLVDAKVGDVVDELGFMSTSAVQRKAMNFATKRPKEGGVRTLVEFVVPKGTNATVVSSAEAEVLLGRGHKLQIVEASEPEDVRGLGGYAKVRRVKAKLVTARADFNPDQPRDENGRWTDEGGGATAAPGKPFLAFRLARSGHRDLNNRNAGNAQAVAAHIARSQDVEGPAPAGGFGNALHVFKVTTKSEFGKYARMNQGVATDPTGKQVGRDDKDMFGKKGGAVVYSFPEDGEFEAEHLAEIPLAHLNDYVKEFAKTYEGGKHAPHVYDFDSAGSTLGGHVIRDYVQKKVFTRNDYDEDQPRDEIGRWTNTGGGGAASTPKKVSYATYKASKEHATKETHAAISQLAQGRAPRLAREGLEKAADARGYATRPYANGRKSLVEVDHWLDSTNVGGSHYHDTGRIVISKKAAEKLDSFAKRWDKDPEWERGRHERLHEDLKSADSLTREGALKIADELLGVHVLTHETLHGYGPLHSEDVEGAGMIVEEVTTEMVTRTQMRDDFGYDVNKAVKANPNVPAGYQPHIEATVTAIMGTYNIPQVAAEQVLEHATIAFKQLPPPPKSYQAIYNHKSALSERMAGAMFNKDETKLKELRAELDALPDVPKPEDLFARTIDAVFAQGPKGEGHIDPKPSESANKLRAKLVEKWSRWL